MEASQEINGESCPRLLKLMMPNNGKWLEKGDNDDEANNNKLELRLGLPGGEDEDNKTKKTKSFIKNGGDRERDESFLSLGNFSLERKKAFAAGGAANAAAAAAVPNNISQKRTAPGPVIGWPPIRSFRKNLSSSSFSKPGNETSPQSKDINTKPEKTDRKGMFVKINMDGIPIGRKIDLTAYGSYQELSMAVDQLFRGLLAAQRELPVAGGMMRDEEEKPITGLLDGKGEYTLVYEDNEGDRVLVGDVPWHMFVSTVKRLRVLKSSELAALSRGSKQGKLAT